MERPTPGKVAAGLLAAVLLIGGSVALTAQRRDPDEPVEPASLEGLVSHVAAGNVPVPAGDAQIQALLLPLGRHGGEPTVGATSSGALFVTGKAPGQNFAAMWRSLDGGARWTNVRFPAARAEFDPFLWVDPDTDRIFSAANQLECSSMLWSDDDGATWQFAGTSLTAACPWRGHDHQTIATGRPREVETTGYDNVVYYSYHSTDAAHEGTYVSRSLDGGATWSLPGGTKVFDRDCQAGLAGRPVVSEDGVVYIPKAGCKGLLVGVSEDSGSTWRVASIDGVGVYGGNGALVSNATKPVPLTPNPSLAIDETGRVYATWTAADTLVWLSQSDDLGRTWSAPTRVSPPEVNATVFTAAVAGSTGRVAVAYFGTTDPAEDWPSRGAHEAPPEATWNLYVTVSANASAADPLFTTLRVNPAEDPVQRGCIYQAGGATAPCRALLDFISAIEIDGRLIVAYADGCPECASAEESDQAAVHLAVLDRGPGLRDGISLTRWRS